MGIGVGVGGFFDFFFFLPAGDFDGVGVLTGAFEVFTTGEFVGLAVGEFVGFGVRDFIGFALGDFVDLITGDLDGVGVMDDDFDGVGVGVLTGETFGDGVALAFCDLGFSGARWTDFGAAGVGHGIAVGSSTGVGCFAGVGLTVTDGFPLGVGVATGSNKRPRLCDIGGDGVCAGVIATPPTIATDNAKNFRIGTKGLLKLSLGRRRRCRRGRCLRGMNAARREHNSFKRRPPEFLNVRVERDQCEPNDDSHHQAANPF